MLGCRELEKAKQANTFLQLASCSALSAAYCFTQLFDALRVTTAMMGQKGQKMPHPF